MALPFACDTVFLYIGVPDQALGWFPLGLGLVAKDVPSELSCACTPASTLLTYENDD